MGTHKIKFFPEEKEVEAANGTSLKDLLNAAGIHCDFPCGGRGKCGKCRVRVHARAAEPKVQETALLTPEEIAAGIRLACLVTVQEDMSVECLSDNNRQHQFLAAALDRSARIDPHLQKRYLEAEKPGMADSRPDLQRIRDSLAAQDEQYAHMETRIEVLRSLPGVLRKDAFRVTAVLHQLELRGLEEGNTAGILLGMAFDIGTTTIVGYLMDLYTGKELSAVSMLNPQTSYGADIISRITHVVQHENGLEELHRAVTGAINRLAGEATEKAGVNRNDIYAVSVVGNTCMHHLFLGITPGQVALAPYAAAVSEPVEVNPSDVRLEINKAGKVFVLPNIAGFVGADTVAALLAADMESSDKVKLMIDIGTNGEIALGSKERLVVCSAAAGPAFEGAQISCGMRGAAGAIDHVSFGGEVDFSVIGDAEPRGMCGSALLDTVAGLLETGIINEKGKFIEPDKITNPGGKKLKNRVMQYNGMWSFLLAGDLENPHSAVMITQRDIRELQLAKGAIAAGMRILMNRCAIEANEIGEVLLAGAFGNYLNPHSACAIGLIPRELEGKIKVVGNAAGLGAKLALLSAKEYARAAALARKVDYVDLGSDRNFNHIFAESMMFPKQS